MAQLGLTGLQRGDEIAAARARIDVLDEQIIGLLRERADVSRSIQDNRLAHGEPRLDTARELVVFRRYRDGLNPAIASAVLLYCRGQLVKGGKGPPEVHGEPRSGLPVMENKGGI